MTTKSIEPLLQEDDNRFVLFPIQYNDIYEMYKKQLDCFWRVDEVDLSKDIILAKLSFSLPQLVDFFVDSFTNLDNLDNNILKPGSNNALINYYSLKLGNIFNTSVEKKENFAVVSQDLMAGYAVKQRKPNPIVIL